MNHRNVFSSKFYFYFFFKFKNDIDEIKNNSYIGMILKVT